jgi:hypothetical protein
MMPTPREEISAWLCSAHAVEYSPSSCAGKEPAVRRATKRWSPFFLLFSSLSPLLHAFGWQLLEDR